MIWHLPAEKTLGLNLLYKKLLSQYLTPSQKWNNATYLDFIKKTFGIPNLSFNNKFCYYFNTYINALKKRFY